MNTQRRRDFKGRVAFGIAKLGADFDSNAERYTVPHTLKWRCIKRHNQRCDTYSNSEHVDYGCRLQLCIQTCGQTAADRKMHMLHGYYWEPIGLRHRTIQRHNRRSPTTYDLVTIHALRTTDMYRMTT